MIQIIGAGAIGCLWLAKFIQAGIPCHLVSRTPQCGAYLSFTDLQRIHHRLPLSHSTQLLAPRCKVQTSTILVCVKAHQVLDALLSQKPYISPSQPIILMHNGMGCAEQVIKYFPNNPIICATTANASLMDKPLSITHTGIGPSYFGLFRQTTIDLAKLITPFQLAMPQVHCVPDITHKCWLKLIINAVINPLTAIYQITNGQLLDKAHQATVQNIIREIYLVTQAEYLTFDIPSLQQTVTNVLKATANNYSSMNRDIYYQRKTEIEFINGYIINKAQKYNIPLPLLTACYDKIKGLEHHS